MDIFWENKNVQNEKTAKSLQNHLKFDYYIMDTKIMYYLEGLGGARRAGRPERTMEERGCQRPALHVAQSA